MVILLREREMRCSADDAAPRALLATRPVTANATVGDLSSPSTTAPSNLVNACTAACIYVTKAFMHVLRH
jgi:hypothetical protein